jgi:hypothetical protein
MYSSEKKRLILLKNFFQKTGFALVTTYRAKLFVFMSNSSSKRKYKPEKETGHIIIAIHTPFHMYVQKWASLLRIAALF